MTGLQHSVLVVDDRPASRYPVVHALKRAGFTVLEASTGREALELSTQKPAVVVLDVKLPDMLGYEVCRRIKANPNTSHVLVLQLSAAFLSDESKIHALESGADAFLTPPVDPNVLVATVRSLVRLHDAESRNRLLGEQWQTTFDALSEGVALVDDSGTFRRVNQAMTVILNLIYSEIEGKPVAEVLEKCFGPDFQLKESAAIQEVQAETRYFRVGRYPVLQREVEAGTILIVSEITEQKRAQAAVLISERLAATGRIANTIAHEINNPLEAITNLLFLMSMSVSENDPIAEQIAETQEMVSRVSRISRQILSFNRESRVRVPCRLFELLEDVLALNNRAIVNKNLVVERDWDESVTVEGFPAQLRQVFSNLLRNAIEASDPGKSLTLRIACCERKDQSVDLYARVSIIDQGVGIPPENLSRIFEAFFTTKDLKGSGIGLWLSNTIVQEHHGEIVIESDTLQAHSGTCVSVLFPCSQ